MKWTHYIAGMILAMTFMVGCSHTSQTPLLTDAEAFLPAEPDSADARLKQVDVQQLRGDEEEAWYALLRTMTDALQRKQPLNDTLANRAYTYYGYASDLGTSSDPNLMRRLAQSALYMGDCYAAQDSTKATEDCYRRAIRFSEKAKDWHTCYIAYQRLAEQVQWSNPEEALELINKAIEIYGKCNDNTKNLLSLYSFASDYAAQISQFNNGDFQESLDLAYKVLKISEDSCWEDHLQVAQMLLAMFRTGGLSSLFSGKGSGLTLGRMAYVQSLNNSTKYHEFYHMQDINRMGWANYYARTLHEYFKYGFPKVYEIENTLEWNADQYMDYRNKNPL